MIKKGMLLGLSLLIPVFGICCSCMPNGEIDAKQYHSYDLIIRGEIVKIDSQQYDNLVTVKIKKTFKGETAEKTVVIKTPSSSAACGIHFLEGEQYLIYATQRKEQYSSILCSRTTLYKRPESCKKTEKAKKDLTYLNKWKNNPPAIEQEESKPEREKP